MYERGEREPGLDTVNKFASFFDVRTDYLLGNTEDRRSPKESIKYGKMIYRELESYREANGMTREQVEDLIDWEGIYNAIENNSYLFDDGILQIIKGFLSFKPEIIAPEEPKLTEGEMMLLELFRRIPADQQRVFLDLGRAYADSLKKGEA